MLCSISNICFCPVCLLGERIIKFINITSDNQRLGSAFDDLNSRLSLLCQVGDDVICPCKICGGGVPDMHPKILTISTPICIRSAFFLCGTQLLLLLLQFTSFHSVISGFIMIILLRVMMMMIVSFWYVESIKFKRGSETL